MLKYLYGLDSLARHRAVATIVRDSINAPATLLDVGGEVSIRCNHLGRFLNGFSITTANVTRPSDVSYGGAELPFNDNSFDVVVSIDTAEHVPRDERAKWVESFFRVAAKVVVLCAPLGTEYQVGVDQYLNDMFSKLFGRDHHYLKEHLDCGLPGVEEIRSWAAGRRFSLRFDGDARVYKKQIETLFRWQKLAGPMKTPAKLFHQLYTLNDYKPMRLLNEPNEFTRRWYLRVDVDQT
jgi:hypothetical protein